MPSVSKKQHNLMEMVAHDPKKAKQLGIPQSVGKDFEKADKGRRFGTGGSPTINRGGKGQMARQQTRYGSIFGEEKNIPNVNNNRYIGKKAGGTVKHDDIKEDKKLIKKAFGMHDSQLHEGKKTNLTKLKGGGMAKESMGPKSMSMDVEKGKKLKFGEHGEQKRGHTKGKEERGFKTLGLQSGAKGGKGTKNAAPIKMAKGGKVKRYDEGGELEGDGVSLGQNKNIGDDVRARAMAAMANREQDIGGGGKTGSTAPRSSAPSLPSRNAFVSKANKAGFAADQTGGGAALMTRKDRRSSGMAKGGVTRADGIAQKGKTRGKMC
jgi:hypothetical protein